MGADDYRECFCKSHDGSWTCINPCTLDTPAGRIQVTNGSRFYPGTTFMNFDLAQWLESRLDDSVAKCESQIRLG